MNFDFSSLKTVQLGSFTLSDVIAAVLLLAVCLLAVRILMRLVNKALAISKIERSLHTFARETVRIVLYVITALIVADTLGIPVTSLIAVLSVAGLAVSLAVQGTLSNLAGGLMILITKPFVVGDHIEAGDTSGVVNEIGLVYTRILTFDNKAIYAPNSDIASAKITNYTAEGKRRVDITVGVPGDALAAQVRAALTAAAARHPEALSDPPVFINIVGYKESSIDYALRVWVETDRYWDVYFALLEEVRQELDARGIPMPYPHLQVHAASR